MNILPKEYLTKGFFSSIIGLNILRKEYFAMYDNMMNSIPDFVHVLLSWLEVLFGSVLEYLGIIEYSDHEGTNVNGENTEG